MDLIDFFYRSAAYRDQCKEERAKIRRKYQIDKSFTICTSFK